MTPRTASRAIGGLFLSAFLLYGGGTFLVASTTGGATPVPEDAASPGQLAAGAALLLLNSAAVVAIGVLAFRVLRRRHPRTANAYLATRTVEAVLLALAPLGMLSLALLAPGGAGSSDVTGPGMSGLARTLVETSGSAYSLAMATLGVGSIFFCRALLRSGLLPRLLAAWGMSGYAILALGSVLELAGVGVELAGSGIGVVMAVPGGLFELAVGTYLLVKGFREVMPASTVATQDGGPATATPGIPVAVTAGSLRNSDG